MRNLKKLLALVLAMVMAFSLMLSAGAVDYEDYPDKDSITAEFVEGVQVLTGLKVFQGDENGFRPSDQITRAEAAAVIYRAVTGDVNDRQTELYKDYSNFADVKSDDWFAGYVGYCQNAGYIKGTSPTTFSPYEKVTGYQVLAMILRAVGYGKNNEFVGGSWQVNVAALSRQLGVTRNVTAAHMERTLNSEAPREVVADLVFMTIATVPMVTYTPALAYNDKADVLGQNGFNQTLGQQTFGLYYDTSWDDIDRWGRPGYRWYQNGARISWTNASNGKAYMIKEGHPLFGDPNGTASVVATIEAVPDYETLDQVRECDVAHALEEKKTFGAEQKFNLFVNGDNNLATAAIDPVTTNYRVVATDTVTKVGGQGRITEVYYKDGSPWFTNETRDVVMIDTFLAQVTGKADAKLDKNDHVITPAKLDVTIWDGNRKTSETNLAANEVNTPSTRIISKTSTSKENWDEYAVGDFILIYANTDKGEPAGSINDHIAPPAGADIEKTAFETNKVTSYQISGYPVNTLVAGSDTSATSTAKVLGKADVKQGKQTVVYYNADKHNVDSTDYDDQITLYLDKAGSNTNTTYNWYFDKNGYLIGIGDAKGSNFGVITSIYAAFGQGETNTDGTVKAIATVKYADGTTGTVEIDRFLMSSTDNGSSVTSTTSGGGAGHKTTIDGVAATDALSSGAYTVELRTVYDQADRYPMSVREPEIAFVTNAAKNDGWLYMAPSAASNFNGHFRTAGGRDKYGILYDNLFMFTTANDNAVMAVEVAGAPTNGGAWVGLLNGRTDTDNGGMLYKSLGFLTLDDGQPGDGTSTAGNTGNLDVIVDNDTKIMVRTGEDSDNSNIVTYNGVNELPGNVVLKMDTEVDWADTDGDGRAEYLYVTGSIPGVVTYGLFYYNGYTGEQAQWNGTTGTVPGYLNGKAETVTFDNKSLFDDVVDSDLSYKGHLFALQITNGTVTSVMTTANVGAFEGSKTAWTMTTKELLNNGANRTGAVLGSDASTGINHANYVNGFKLGTANGNPYSVTTEAVYFRDSNVADTNSSELVYNRATAGQRESISVEFGAVGNRVNKTFWISPSTNIVGDLEWLNTRAGCDVTIVYDNTTAAEAAIRDIYITPDPDVTPNPTPGTPDMIDIVSVGGDGNNIYLDLISNVALNYNATLANSDFDEVSYLVQSYPNMGTVCAGSFRHGVGITDNTKDLNSDGITPTSLVLPHGSTNDNHGTFVITITYLKGGTTLVTTSELVTIS